jgi:hypothetical protein
MYFTIQISEALQVVKIYTKAPAIILSSYIVCNLQYMLRALLYIFVIYLAYQFIFNFLVPLYKATQQVKKGFRDMHNQMNNANENKNASPQQPHSQKKGKEIVGEYIDFEEIK